MRSRQLETVLTGFVQAAAAHLHAEVASGAEIPFEVGSQAGRGRRSGTPLYCYRALTGAFIAEREPALESVPGHAEAVRLLERFDGLERYLAGGGADSREPAQRPRAALKALLEDVFQEQTDFELRPERLRAALARLEESAFASTSEVTLVATLHGLTIASQELAVTKGLTIARPDALEGLPDGVISAQAESPKAESHLVVALALKDDDASAAVLKSRDVLKDLLRALRLFGDGRVTLGALAWVRVGAGAWTPLALGAGGRPHGMLVVTAEQEDELRAFCNLVSRRAPHDNELAWALRRFELGCERESPYEALSDHLLALRALLEPEGPSSGLLAGRLAALCATPEQRLDLTEQTVQVVALERAVIAGSARHGRRAKGAGTGGEAADQRLMEDLARHLRALLRDVICGHLPGDLATLADELLDQQEAAEVQTGEVPAPAGELVHAT
jgi:hypothetical protein